MPETVHFIFVCKWRPRTNQGHFTLENIKKLRQLIHARPAKNTSDARNARIIRHLVNALGIAIALAFVSAAYKCLHEILVNFEVIVGMHGTEFQARERLAKLPEPLLLEENRALRTQLHDDCDQGE